MAKLADTAELVRLQMVKESLEVDDFTDWECEKISILMRDCRLRWARNLAGKKFTFKLDCDSERLPPCNAYIKAVRNKQNRDNTLAFARCFDCDNVKELEYLLEHFGEYFNEPLLSEHLEYTDRWGKPCNPSIIESLFFDDNYLTEIGLL